MAIFIHIYHEFKKHLGKFTLGVAPSQDSSDHQNCYIFRIGDPNLNLHLPLLLGGGHIQNIPYLWTPKPWKMKVLGPTNMGYKL